MDCVHDNNQIYCGPGFSRSNFGSNDMLEYRIIHDLNDEVEDDEAEAYWGCEGVKQFIVDF